MKERRMRKGSSKRLTAARRAEIDALAAMPEDRIDTRAIPEIGDWSGANRGLFYRPVKQQITLRIDADVVAWFKEHTPGGQGYQSDINRALRAYVRQHRQQKSRCRLRRARAADARPKARRSGK